MSYITDGTFWFVVVSLLAVIGVVYYLLKTKTEETQKDLSNLRKSLADGFRDLGAASTSVEAQRDQDTKDIFTELSKIYKVLAHLTERIDSIEKKDKKASAKKTR